MKNRQVITGLDRNNRAISHVPLANHPDDRYATLYKSDLEYIQELGLGLNWFQIRGSVFSATPYGGQVSIARVLLDAQPGYRVIPKDESGYNLRRDNLMLKKGYSKQADKTVLVDSVARKNKAKAARAKEKQLASTN